MFLWLRRSVDAVHVCVRLFLFSRPEMDVESVVIGGGGETVSLTDCDRLDLTDVVCPWDQETRHQTHF